MERPEFLFIDKSVIINTDYVYRIDGDQVVMTDQKAFVISRRRVTEVKNKILKYWNI